MHDARKASCFPCTSRCQVPSFRGKGMSALDVANMARQFLQHHLNAGLREPQNRPRLPEEPAWVCELCLAPDILPKVMHSTLHTTSLFLFLPEDCCSFPSPITFVVQRGKDAATQVLPSKAKGSLKWAQTVRRGWKQRSLALLSCSGLPEAPAAEASRPEAQQDRLMGVMGGKRERERQDQNRQPGQLSEPRAIIALQPSGHE